MNENLLHKSLIKVEKLGEELIKTSKNWNYPFKNEWLQQLLLKYRKKPGKAIIHLDNLPDKVRVSFNEKGKTLLWNLFNELKNNIYGYSAYHLYANGKALYNYLKNHNNTTSISLLNLRRYCKAANWDINSLEKYVIQIKSTLNGKIIKNKKFPINLLTRSGGIFIGSIPDTSLGYRFTFKSKDEDFIHLYRYAIWNLIGKIESKRRFWNDCHTIRFTSFLNDIAGIIGFETKGKQIRTNNPLPLFLFQHDKVRRESLKTLFDAEGSANFSGKKDRYTRSVILTQVVMLKKIKLKGSKIRFTQLSKKLKKQIINQPPLLLVSAQILLFSEGIHSCLSPSLIYKKNKKWRVRCDIRITGQDNLRKFREKIGFNLIRKLETLELMLDSFKNNSRSNVYKKN